MNSVASQHPGAFAVGDRVRVRTQRPDANPRTPAYLRDHAGVVVAVHGVVDNPLDHREPYPPLYTILFGVTDLFGTAGSDQVCADLHEEWLEADPGASGAGP